MGGLRIPNCEPQPQPQAAKRLVTIATAVAALSVEAVGAQVRRWGTNLMGLRGALQCCVQTYLPL